MSVTERLMQARARETYNDEVEFGRIRKNATEEIVITCGTFKGRAVISQRVWANGVPLSGKGYVCDARHAPALIEAFTKIRDRGPAGQ